MNGLTRTSIERGRRYRVVKVLAAVLVIGSTLSGCAGKEATVQKECPKHLLCPACGYEFEAPAGG